MENVVYDPWTRKVNYKDSSITENTRSAYPIDFIPHARIPCLAGHPSHLIFLTCDAFGVLPPVSKLTIEQSMYHFISGYTAKIGGTEDGIKEPTATFSACFGAPFLVWHPVKYAQMLAERISLHSADAWLVNTGWIGGRYGIGSRIKLQYSRAIINAIHSGELSKAEYEQHSVFNLAIPKQVSNIPSEILHPERAWSDQKSYFETLRTLAQLFIDNFKQYEDKACPSSRNGGPIL